MRVLQINTVYKKNSTGRTCWEVERALESRGHRCLTLHQLGPHISEEHDYIINNRLEYYLHKFLSRLFGLDGYYSFNATKRAIKKIDDFQPDIIHLRNLHGGYLNLPLLFRYLKVAGKPVIYNLHDTWAYTGKCPEYENVKCNKWRTECYNCPQFKRYPKSWFFDQSKKIYLDKANWYKEINDLTIVGVSDYMKEEAKKSPLFSGRRVERIYNWIDLETFKPVKGVLREKYGLKEGFLVLGVSSFWKKNTEYEEMCKLAEALQDEAQICLVGGENLNLPFPNMIHIPFTESTAVLAELYSLADVFVCLSTAESFGKVAAEAVACGTPAIVYDTTGIAEIPINGCGYVVPKHDIDAVRKSALIIKSRGKSYYAKKCRQRAESQFSYHKNVSELIGLYEDLVNEKSI